MVNKILFDTKYLQLKETPSKNGNSWYYAHRPNAENVVVIVPVVGEDVLFLIEERPPIIAEGKGKYSVGLPAGLVGDERKGESTMDAIKAELLEEAGLSADTVKICAKKVASSSGCLSETCTIAIAYLKDKNIVAEPLNDGGIIVDRVWVRKDEIRDWLKRMEDKGYVISAHTLAGLFYIFMEDKL